MYFSTALPSLPLDRTALSILFARFSYTPADISISAFNILITATAKQRSTDELLKIMEHLDFPRHDSNPIGSDVKSNLC